MAIEPIVESRVVPIAQLTPGDHVRVTLTKHAIFGKPLAVVENQLVGHVNAIYEERVLARGWALQLDLEGMGTAIRIDNAWTVELIDREPDATA